MVFPSSVFLTYTFMYSHLKYLFTIITITHHNDPFKSELFSWWQLVKPTDLYTARKPVDKYTNVGTYPSVLV